MNATHWLGRGNKEAADEAACDAINGVFDLVEIRGEVVIGEGIKDKAPGIFLRDKLAEERRVLRVSISPLIPSTALSTWPKDCQIRSPSWLRRTSRKTSPMAEAKWSTRFAEPANMPSEGAEDAYDQSL